MAGVEQATTAEALMRSRYTAYAVGDLPHLRRSWHPDTRPPGLTLVPGRRWVGLEILDVAAGRALDLTGEVEFVARYEDGDEAGAQHERSRFVRHGGRWVYVDAASPAG